MWILRRISKIETINKLNIIYCISVVIIISVVTEVLGKCPERCVCEGHKVNCSNQYFSEFPIRLDTHVIEFDGSHNNFAIVKSNNILEFRVISLEVINLSNNKIKEINKDAFIGQNNLKKVDLSFNKITSIANKMFQENEYLEWLSLSHNSNLKLTYENFIISNSLTFLNLSKCGINTLYQNNFGGTKNIEILDISYNELTDVTPLNVLKNLTELYVNNNKLHSLDNLSKLLEVLRKCDVCNNNLTYLNETSLKIIAKTGITINMSSNPWNCSILCQKIFEQDHLPHGVCKYNISESLEKLYDECFCSTKYSSYFINPLVSNTEIFVLFSEDVKCTKFIVDCAPENSVLQQEKLSDNLRNVWKLKKKCTCSCDKTMKTLKLTSSECRCFCETWINILILIQFLGILM